MNTYELAKKFIAGQRYRVCYEECSEGCIVFRYQMNTMHIFVNTEDEHFLFMTLLNFTDVTKENLEQVEENCHQLNKETKLVKFYVMNDMILATVEAYYLAEEDFNFQMMNALKHLVEAKVMYKKLYE